MSNTFSKKSKNLFFSSDVTVFSLHEQHDASLNFWFRTHIILAKNVPWHILTLSAVACDMFLLRASAHIFLWKWKNTAKLLVSPIRNLLPRWQRNFAVFPPSPTDMKSFRKNRYTPLSAFTNLRMKLPYTVFGSWTAKSWCRSLPYLRG